jgi:peptide/nickel transport system substrate-binding protein
MRSYLPIPALAVMFVSTLLVSGCGQPAEPGEGRQDTVVLAESIEYESLNPLDQMFGISTKFYDGLYAVDTGGDIVPALATAAPVSNQHLTEWTVTLRDDVRFSDGTDFESSDVVATYQAILSDTMASPLKSRLSMVKQVAADDARTVRFSLDFPYAAFPSTLTVGLAPSERLGKSVLESELNRSPVGTGPYLLEEWRDGESMTLVANEDYWGGAPAVRRLVIAFVADENARAQRLRAGDFHGAQLSPLNARLLDDADGLELFSNPSADFRAISLPQDAPGMNSLAVRRALNYATNREAMVDGILSGYGEPAFSPFTRVQGESFNEAAIFEYDVAKAEALLEADGWTMGHDGVRVRDGVRLELPVMYFAEDVLRRDLAQAFASDMSKIGISVHLQAATRKQAVEGMNSKLFVLGGGDAPYDPDTQAYSVLSSDFAAYDPNDAYSNPSNYSNPEVDRLLEAARQSADPSERSALYRRIQALLIDDPAMVFLVALEHTYVARGLDGYDGVEHVVEPHEHGVAWGPWWNIEAWKPTR